MCYAHGDLESLICCTIAAVTQLEVSLPLTKVDKLCVSVHVRRHMHGPSFDSEIHLDTEQLELVF
jgi:hypothetical protein